MLNRLQESDIKLLRVFFAVASCNGFTAAEPVLRMQRPNISAAIKKLEERLDLVLCHRGRGGFQMTKEGEMVFNETKRVFATFDSFVFNIKSLHDDYSGHITLVLMSGLSDDILLAVSKAIRSTMNHFDDIHINIQTKHYNEVEHVALSGECHLVLTCFEMVKPETVVFHPIDQFCKGRLYCSEQHPLANQWGKDPSVLELEKYPAVGISGIASGNYFKDDHQLSVKTSSDSFDTSLSAVMTGQYLGLLPDWLSKSERYAKKLIPLAGDTFEFEYQLYVMMAKTTLMNPVLKHCIQELVYYVGQVE